MDGLIVAAGLVLLHAAGSGRSAPGLARCMLWLGISATLGANVSYGLPFGPLGAVVSAWPAIAFVGSAELALGMVRSASAAVPAEVRGVPAAVPERPDAPAVPAASLAVVPAYPEAHEVFAAELAAGQVPTICAIRAGLAVGQDKASKVQAYLAALPAGGDGDAA